MSGNMFKLYPYMPAFCYMFYNNIKYANVKLHASDKIRLPIVPPTRETILEDTCVIRHDFCTFSKHYSHILSWKHYWVDL